MRVRYVETLKKSLSTISRAFSAFVRHSTYRPIIMSYPILYSVPVPLWRCTGNGFATRTPYLSRSLAGHGGMGRFRRRFDSEPAIGRALLPVRTAVCRGTRRRRRPRLLQRRFLDHSQAGSRGLVTRHHRHHHGRLADPAVIEWRRRLRRHQWRRFEFVPVAPGHGHGCIRPVSDHRRPDGRARLRWWSERI